jgi:hypothetical protein
LFVALITAVFLVPGVTGSLRGFAYNRAPACGATIAPSCRGRRPVRIHFVDYDVHDTGPPADVAEIVDVIGTDFRQRVEVHGDISPLGARGDAEIWRGDVTAVDISGRRLATNLQPHFTGSLLRTIFGVALLAVPVGLAAAARVRRRTRRVPPGSQEVHQ